MKIDIFCCARQLLAIYYICIYVRTCTFDMCYVCGFLSLDVEVRADGPALMILEAIAFVFLLRMYALRIRKYIQFKMYQTYNYVHVQSMYT